MNDIPPSPRLADGGLERPPATTNGTGNAFGQLLRSMEQTMWAHAASGPSSPGKPASSQPAYDAVRPRPAAGMAASAPVAPPLEPIATRTSPTLHAALVATPAEAKVEAARPDGRRELPAAPAPATALQAVPYASTSAGSRSNPAGAPVAASADDESRASASADVDARPASPPAPLRITLMPGETGAVSVALRIGPAGPDDLDTLDSQVRATLLQGGFRTSKLVINGVDRTVTASGDTPHGD
ncbi:hypothetical protein [Burkholderia gladioli]|uniref:hypothetical protein n=1 Tax=Burkholderia gladioli TaxID=28095 RepID=UPI0016411186|nr:hypothetical protein [Burkholderia gladioli]